jgi:hypothetical protein
MYLSRIEGYERADEAKRRESVRINLSESMDLDRVYFDTNMTAYQVLFRKKVAPF